MDIPGILSGIKEAVEQLLPFRTVHSFEQGLRWTYGKPGNILRSGIHWFIPIIQSIDIVDVTLNSVDLDPQAIKTSDDVECVVKAGITYYIYDIKKLYTTLQNDEIECGIPTIENIAKGLIATYLSNCTYNGVWKDKELVEAEIATEINARVRSYGIKISDVSISDIGRVTNYRIFSPGAILPVS